MLWPHRRSANGLTDEERETLEAWVRLRFHLASSDPMIAIIGAVARLTDAGMTEADAAEIVLRIMREGAGSPVARSGSGTNRSGS
jgi:hypothetical protein